MFFKLYNLGIRSQFAIYPYTLRIHNYSLYGSIATTNIEDIQTFRFIKDLEHAKDQIKHKTNSYPDPK